MLPTLTTDQRIRIVAAADPREEAVARFSAAYQVRGFSDATSLFSKDDVDAVYLGTPAALHASQAVAAMHAGKHVLVEKPLGVSVDECRRVVAAQADTGRSLVVGHTHAFDAVPRAMRTAIDAGRIGRVLMVSNWTFTDFLYRPRRPDEFDTARGGGIMFNQLPHQVDIARLLAGSEVTAVRTAAFVADPARPAPGAHTTLLHFRDGAVASLVYSGSDFFDSDELFASSSSSRWITEDGRATTAHHGAARQALRVRGEGMAEEQMRSRLSDSLVAELPTSAGQQHFGMTVVNGEHGDIRTTALGFTLYDADGAHEVTLPIPRVAPDRTPVVDELWESIAHGRPSRHDATWGMATVAVCVAALTSAERRSEVALG